MVSSERIRYLSDIATTIRDYGAWSERQAELARLRQSLLLVRQELGDTAGEAVQTKLSQVETELDPGCKEQLDEWPQRLKQYRAEEFVYQVRGRDVTQPMYRVDIAPTHTSCRPTEDERPR